MKVCLAYSGGLDTSVILKWLINQGYEVICFMADVGQIEDFQAAKQKAMQIGASECIIKDLKHEFLTTTIYQAIQSNATYENVYLLGTALARPIIAKSQIETAISHNCTHIGHGCTGKGNDQLRFELAYMTLSPKLKIIAPWRLPVFYNEFQGRSDLIKFANENGIPVDATPKQPWSMDENMYHCSYEAGILEDPNQTPPNEMWRNTLNLMDAQNTPDYIELEFKKGLPHALKWSDSPEMNKNLLNDPMDIFMKLTEFAKQHGIGRIDIVENRTIGMKSRGCYETPAGTIIRKLHMDLEGLVMDKHVRRYRDELSVKYAELLYDGQYFAPECQLIIKAIQETQLQVRGSVKCMLFKGNIVILSRHSDDMKYSKELASMDEIGDYDPQDANGFIKLNGLRHLHK
eukprot:NODE_362_length_8790_cov_0.566678.p1 type:complete len:403 gc:universal NODE_362_length_8790_cov_0.566678:1509-2717(+)